jgi:hypothetical protein
MLINITGFQNRLEWNSNTLHTTVVAAGTFHIATEAPVGGLGSVCSVGTVPRCTTSAQLLLCDSSCVMLTWQNVTSGVLWRATGAVSSRGQTWPSTVLLPTTTSVQVCFDAGWRDGDVFNASVTLEDMSSQSITVRPPGFVVDRSPPVPSALAARFPGLAVFNGVGSPQNYTLDPWSLNITLVEPFVDDHTGVTTYRVWLQREVVVGGVVSYETVYEVPGGVSRAELEERQGVVSVTLSGEIECGAWYRWAVGAVNGAGCATPPSANIASFRFVANTKPPINGVVDVVQSSTGTSTAWRDALRLPAVQCIPSLDRAVVRICCLKHPCSSLYVVRRLASLFVQTCFV